MNALCLCLALFGADIEEIRKLPDETECDAQIEYCFDRIEDTRFVSTQLEQEAKQALLGWVDVWLVVRRCKSVNQDDGGDPDVSVLRGRQEEVRSLWERLAALREMRMRQR